MKLISLTFVLVSGFALNLMAVPAAPNFVTFTQSDGSAFQAYLKGDENFSWIETQNKQVLIKRKSSGFFEFTLVEEDTDKRLKLVPSGIPLINRVQSVVSSGTELPNITRQQLVKMWQRNIAAKRNIKLMPTKSSP